MPKQGTSAGTLTTGGLTTHFASYCDSLPAFSTVDCTDETVFGKLDSIIEMIKQLKTVPEEKKQKRKTPNWSDLDR